MDAARRQRSTGRPALRSVVPVSNLFAFATNSLIVETARLTVPLLAWPPSHRAIVTPTGALHVVERGRVVKRFAAGEWITVGRLINIRAEHRAVVVVELRPSEAA